MHRPAANVVLCLLTLVGSTSVSVRHAHARGGLPHAVGGGPVVSCPRGAGDDCDGRHEHVLLCGVELYHHDAPDENAPACPTPAPEQVTLGFGDACDHRTDPAAADPAGGDLLALPFSPTALARPTAAPADTRGATPRPVCDSARGARTGVLTV